MDSYPGDFPFGIMDVVELLHLRISCLLYTSAGQAGTFPGLEDEETGSIFAPAPKCCTNGEGSYFAPKITKGDLICPAAIVPVSYTHLDVYKRQP